jgi:hypothetical protein
MISRTVMILTIIGSVMHLAMAALHASGYSYITKSLTESDVSDFLKDILPILFLYPSVVMVALVIFALSSLRKKEAAFIFAAISLALLINTVPGFILGGLILGGVLLFATGLFSAPSFLASKAE